MYMKSSNVLKNDEKSIKDTPFYCLIEKNCLYLQRTNVQYKNTNIIYPKINHYGKEKH